MDRKKVRESKIILDSIIGRNIIIERKSKNISRKELAKLIGLTPTHLGLIERGERGANCAVLCKLGQVFNKPIDCLFYERVSLSSFLENPEAYDLETRKKRIIALMAGLANEERELVTKIIKDVLSQDHTHL